MNKPERMSGSHTPVVFILALFLLLALLSGAVIMYGNNVYEKIADGMDENYERRVSLSYIATKIRQNDVSGRIYTDTRDGAELLAIKEVYGELEFVTYIYYHNGYIRELFLDMYEGKPADFELDDGFEIIPAGDLNFKVYPNRVEFSVEDTRGGVRSMTLALRAA